MDGRGHWVRVERGPALARVATTLLVVVAAYVAGAAQTATIRWIAVALTLLGIVQLALLLRQLIHREGRRDDLLQAILDAVPHILFYKDADSRYMGINPVFERTFGVRAEDVVGKTDAELFGQALHDRFVAQDRELLATGGACTFEEQMPIDREIHYIESRKTPFHDAQGNAVGIVGLAMDVTEHHRLRQQLEVGNARLSLALRAARLGTWTWNADTDEFDLDAFEGRLFGLAEGRHHVADLLAGNNIHPDDLEVVRDAARRALREGEAVGYEFRAPDKQKGGWRWSEGSVIRYLEPGNELVQAQLIPNVTLVNGNPLTRANLVHGIAVALGRVSAPVAAIAEDVGGVPVRPLSRDMEAAAGRLILLAEDNSTNRDVIARQLARLGYACDVAEDGSRAWTMLASGDARYALLLTDCHMPHLDGYELTRRIRGHERSNGGESLPIVAITANALQGEGERCLALGMNGYLAKPLQIRELKRILEEFLPPVPADRIAMSSDIGDSSWGDGTRRFHELREILDGDEVKLRHVLGVFEQSTRKDCEQLDAAQAAGDWRRIRDLAHKLRSGCRQLGENVAALALEAVEKRAGSDSDPEEEFVVARRELHQVLARVDAYLAAEPARPSECAD